MTMMKSDFVTPRFMRQTLHYHQTMKTVKTTKILTRITPTIESELDSVNMYQFARSRLKVI